MIMCECLKDFGIGVQWFLRWYVLFTTIQLVIAGIMTGISYGITLLTKSVYVGIGVYLIFYVIYLIVMYKFMQHSCMNVLAKEDMVETDNMTQAVAILEAGNMTEATTLQEHMLIFCQPVVFFVVMGMTNCLFGSLFLQLLNNSIRIRMTF